MYFEDALCLESHLNNDWTVFLRNLKQREDCHFQLLQYNKRIISRQRDDDDELFVKDEISQHQQQFNKIKALSDSMEEEQKELIEKYSGSTVSFEQIIKLMGRVASRILEICQSSLDKCKSFNEKLVDNHSKMKTALVRVINNKDKVNLEEIINIVVNYSKTKLIEEINRLKKLIVGLENGQYERLQKIYAYQPPKVAITIEKRKQKSIQKIIGTSKGKDNSPLLKDESKKTQIRKQKQKFINKMIFGLYSTMDLSKTQLFEDMCGNQKEKSKEILYNQLMSRNKFNYEQILTFQAKKDLFHEKVRIFKQMMEQQSRKIAEVLIRKPIAKQKQELSQSFIIKKPMNQSIVRQSSEDLSLLEKNNSPNRYRIHSPRGKKQESSLSDCYTTPIQFTQQNFSHFKFDKSNKETYLRTNRRKLPHIPPFSNAVGETSVDNKLETVKNNLNNQSGEKQLKLQFENIEEVLKNQNNKEFKNRYERLGTYRTKVVLKNIEVGVEGVTKKQEPIAQSKEKKKIEPNPMQYTFYVRKSGFKFFEPKNNIAV